MAPQRQRIGSYRIWGLLLMVVTPSIANGKPEKNYLGVTLGGQHIWYGMEGMRKFNDHHAITGSYSYIPVGLGDHFYGMQYDYFPFGGAFALSPSISLWDLRYGYSVVVPNMGIAHEKFFGNGRWLFKSRLLVLYQTRKELIIPWLGFSLMHGF